MTISALVLAQHLTWKGAELASAIASSNAWANTTGPTSECIYREEAVRLATELQAQLGDILGQLANAPAKERA